MPFFNVGEVRVATDEDVKYVMQMCDDNTDWAEDYRKGDLAVYSKSNSLSDFRLLKIRNKLTDVSADVIFDVLHDTVYRKLWDKVMIDSYEICQLNPNNDIGYYAMKTMSPFKNRDFVMQRSWLQTNDYNIIFNHSVFHKQCPPRKSFVRAVTYVAAYLMRPLGPKSCEVVYLAQTDPRGKLPSWAVNKFTRYVAPRIVNNLNKAAKGYPAWKAKHNPDHRPWIFPDQLEVPRIVWTDILEQSDLSTDPIIDESNVDEGSVSLDKDVPKLKSSNSGDNLVGCNGKS
jgi:StAR-related lipid transfer protein 10